tara:strand:+ start:960 stop:1622 length:663 start_codon:yes stop_codon:yes gene_type:complete
MQSHGFLKSYIDVGIIEQLYSSCQKFIDKQENVNNYYSNIDKYIANITKLINPRITNKVKELLNKDEIILNACELHVQLSKGLPIPHHQDNFYHCSEYNKGLKILIPLQDFNRNNGALGFLNHNYDYPVLDHKASKINNFSSIISKKDISNLIYESTFYKYEVGDASYHFLNSIHYSEGNKTKTNTIFVVFRFQTKDARIDIDAQQKYINCVENHKRLIS